MLAFGFLYLRIGKAAVRCWPAAAPRALQSRRLPIRGGGGAWAGCSPRPATSPPARPNARRNTVKSSGKSDQMRAVVRTCHGPVSDISSSSRSSSSSADDDADASAEIHLRKTNPTPNRSMNSPRRRGGENEVVGRTLGKDLRPNLPPPSSARLRTGPPCAVRRPFPRRRYRPSPSTSPPSPRRSPAARRGRTATTELLTAAQGRVAT